MGGYLDALENSNVFIPTAALLVIVLLVWAQLSARGDPDKDFNLVLGFVWTYLAILFALIAVSVFILTTAPLAKGFLVMSLLMTAGNVVITLSLIIAKLIFKEPFSKSLTRVYLSDDFGEKGIWIVFWLFALVGLAFISFSIGCTWVWACFGVGMTVLLADAIYGFRMIQRARKKQRVKDSNSDKQVCQELVFTVVIVWALIKSLGSLLKKNDQSKYLTQHLHP